MRYKVKVLDKLGAQPVEQPSGKIAEIGATFSTDRYEWIRARRHWHYLEITEHDSFADVEKTEPKKKAKSKKGKAK